MEVSIIAAQLEVRWQDGQILQTFVAPFCIFEDGPMDPQSGILPPGGRYLDWNFENFFRHLAAGRHQPNKVFGLRISAEVVISVGMLFNDASAWPLFPE